MAENRVIKGDYDGYSLFYEKHELYMRRGASKRIDVDFKTVEYHTIVDEQAYKSTSSAITRALIGSFLIGPAGLLAGVTTKGKSTYLIALQFKDGNKSLLEVDENYKKLITQNCF